MDWGAWLAFAGVIVTVLVAPKIDAKRKERAQARADAIGDNKTELEAIRAEARDLREQLKEQINDLKNEAVKKDARIEVLEAKVGELQHVVEMFRLGLTHPPGFVLLPANVWTSLRDRLGDQLPPGPFVGENEDTPPRFGHVGLRRPEDQ